MLPIHTLFEGFIYPNTIKKTRVKVLDADQSQTRFLPFKKLYNKYVKTRKANFKVGPTSKYPKSGRSKLPSYSKGRV